MERSIDALKEVVVSLRNIADDNGFDYETKVNDWMFSVECEYQAYYGLEEDDWGVIEVKESEVKRGYDTDSTEGRGAYRDGEPAYEQTSEVE